MNYEQIKAFLTIVDKQSLSKAAETLFVSQSTISHRIASLEAELSSQLLVRRKGQRQIELTPAGERFLPIALRWSSLWDETSLAIQGDLSTVIRIGGVESIIGYYLRPFFSKYMNGSNHHTKLHISIFSSEIAYSMMETHEIEVGFVTIPMWNKELVFTPILEEGYKLVCFDPDHRWPDAIHPKDLDQKDELSQPWAPEYQQWHNYWWPNQRAFFTYVNNSNLLQRELMESNAIWTIVTDCIAENYRQIPGYHIVELLDAPPKRTAYMITHKHPQQVKAEAIERFVAQIVAFSKKTKRLKK